MENPKGYVDLAFSEYGGRALYANDEFFAEKENLLKPGRGVFIVDKYTDRGKWMDGWESRRKRGPGNDWCVIKLAFPGVIKCLDIDTNHFTGNHPPFASVDGLYLDKEPAVSAWEKQSFDWIPILGKSNLNPGSQHLFDVSCKQVCNYIRLNIFPDGGVARFRVYGEVKVDWEKFKKGEVVELSGIANGGRALTCSDMFYSHPGNLLKLGRGVNMGDGWETKRRRGPGNDWVIIKLGKPGVIEKFELDTAHFKGNFPDRCSILGIMSDRDDVSADDKGWKEIVPETKLKADHQHYFTKEILSHGPVSHLKLNSFPDGGVSRFRAFGKV